VIKLFGRDGAKVRESITPSITVGDDFFTRVVMPKGDRCFVKSQGSPHPRGVIRGRDIDYLSVQPAFISCLDKEFACVGTLAIPSELER
jgi:hypothetical protein